MFLWPRDRNAETRLPPMKPPAPVTTISDDASRGILILLSPYLQLFPTHGNKTTGRAVLRSSEHAERCELSGFTWQIALEQEWGARLEAHRGAALPALPASTAEYSANDKAQVEGGMK